MSHRDLTFAMFDVDKFNSGQIDFRLHARERRLITCSRVTQFTRCVQKHPNSNWERVALAREGGKKNKRERQAWVSWQVTFTLQKCRHVYITIKMRGGPRYIFHLKHTFQRRLCWCEGEFPLVLCFLRDWLMLTGVFVLRLPSKEKVERGLEAMRSYKGPLKDS